MKKWRGIYWIIGAVFFAFCGDVVETETAKGEATGEELAQIFCASCHQFPEPQLLDQKTWKNTVLIRMGAFMGIYENNQRYFDQMPKEWLEPGIGGQRVVKAKVYPDKPTLSRIDWEKIKKYYLDNAPEKLQAVSPKMAIKIGIPSFESRLFATERTLSGLIQGIGIDAAKKRIFVSMHQGGVFQLNYQGLVRAYAPGNSFISQISSKANEFTILDMGTRLASDNPQGSLHQSLSFLNFRKNQSTISIENLMRPVHFSVADLNGDQREDFVISEYGNLLGNLAWYEIKPDGSSEKHSLFPDDGAIVSHIVDVNKDGHPDIYALQANADEGIDLYTNDGKGNFNRERKLRFPPSYGSTHMEVVDFDKDGAEDFLVCHGDNGDYTPLIKPYHGVRLYTKQNGQFKESFFLPLNGAYQATAKDFDLDGDLDIAAVSFHPDFQNKPQESFVLFVNDGSNNFEAYTIPQYSNSRWMRFACTDIDGDQDIDILLSAFNIQTPEIPAEVAELWKKSDEPILLLENKTK